MLKRGSWRRRHWSQRVLSVFTTVGVAGISQQGHAKECRRTCIRVTRVQMWPHYKRNHVRLHFESMEAKLTLRVMGFAVLLGERVVDRTGGPQHVYHYTQRNSASDERAWMLQFATFADLEKAVRLFQAMRTHPHSSKATEGLQEAVKTANSEGAGCAEKVGAAAAAAAAAVEDSDTAVAASGAPHHDDAPLADELEGPGFTPFSVMEGDVTGDLEFIRLQWELLHSTSVDVA